MKTPPKDKGRSDSWGKGKGKNDWQKGQKSSDGRGKSGGGWGSRYESYHDGRDYAPYQNKKHRTESYCLPTAYDKRYWDWKKGQWVYPNQSSGRQQKGGSGGRGWKNDSSNQDWYADYWPKSGSDLRGSKGP